MSENRGGAENSDVDAAGRRRGKCNAEEGGVRCDCLRFQRGTNRMLCICDHTGPQHEEAQAGCRGIRRGRQCGCREFSQVDGDASGYCYVCAHAQRDHDTVDVPQATSIMGNASAPTTPRLEAGRRTNVGAAAPSSVRRPIGSGSAPTTPSLGAGQRHSGAAILGSGRRGTMPVEGEIAEGIRAAIRQARTSDLERSSSGHGGRRSHAGRKSYVELGIPRIVEIRFVRKVKGKKRTDLKLQKFGIRMSIELPRTLTVGEAKLIIRSKAEENEDFRAMFTNVGILMCSGSDRLYRTLDGGDLREDMAFTYSAVSYYNTLFDEEEDEEPQRKRTRIVDEYVLSSDSENEGVGGVVNDEIDQRNTRRSLGENQETNVGAGVNGTRRNLATLANQEGVPVINDVRMIRILPIPPMNGAQAITSRNAAKIRVIQETFFVQEAISQKVLAMHDNDLDSSLNWFAEVVSEKPDAARLMELFMFFAFNEKPGEEDEEEKTHIRLQTTGKSSAEITENIIELLQGQGGIYDKRVSVTLDEAVGDGAVGEYVHRIRRDVVERGVLEGLEDHRIPRKDEDLMLANAYVTAGQCLAHVARQGKTVYAGLAKCMKDAICGKFLKNQIVPVTAVPNAEIQALLIKIWERQVGNELTLAEKQSVFGLAMGTSFGKYTLHMANPYVVRDEEATAFCNDVAYYHLIENRISEIRSFAAGFNFICNFDEFVSMGVRDAGNSITEPLVDVLFPPANMIPVSRQDLLSLMHYEGPTDPATTWLKSVVEDVVACLSEDPREELSTEKFLMVLTASPYCFDTSTGGIGWLFDTTHTNAPTDVYIATCAKKVWIGEAWWTNPDASRKGRAGLIEYLKGAVRIGHVGLDRL